MLRFIDSMDHYAQGDLSEKYTSVSNMRVLAGAGRRGTACLHAITNAEWCALTLDPQPRWIVGFALRFGGTAGANALVCALAAAGVTQVGLLVTPEGYVGLFCGATILGISTQALHDDIYYYVETNVLIGAAGEAIVRVDGVEWLHLSGVDTEATPGVLPNQIRLGSDTLTALTNLYLDDLYICDGQGGGTFATFLGDCRVDALFPNADGTHTAWTPSAGTAHAPLVDEPVPNNDTDYVSATPGGARDSYQLQPLPTMPNPEVLAVQALISARKEDVDEIRISPLLVSGGVTAVAPTVHALTASYLYARDLWTADPNGGGAWTEAAVNSLQVGVERLA
jgi:hypothetical protein